MNGVIICGTSNFPGLMPADASAFYARNLLNFLKPAIIDGELRIDWEDEVFAAACVTHDGAVKHEATAKLLGGA